MDLYNIFKSLIIYFVIIYLKKYVWSQDNEPLKFDSCSLKILTLESDETTRENDTSKYDLKKTGYLNNHLEYEFKPDGRCAAVMYGEKYVWINDFTNNPKYPLKVKVDPPNKSLWVIFGEYDYATFHLKEDDSWQFVPSVSFGTAGQYKHPKTGPFVPKTPVVPVTPLDEERVKEMFKDLLRTEFGVDDQQVLNDYLQFIVEKFKEEGRGEVDLRLPYVRGLVVELVEKEFSLQRVTKPTPSSEETTEPTVPEDDFQFPTSFPSRPEDGELVEPLFEESEEYYGPNHFKEKLRGLVEKLDAKTVPSEDRHYKLKLFTLEGDNLLRVNDTTKYNVESVRSSYSHHYFKFDLKQDTKLVALYLAEKEEVLKDRLFWVHNPDEHGDKYPSKVYYNPSYKGVEVVFDDDFFYAYRYRELYKKLRLYRKVVPTSVAHLSSLLPTPLDEERVKEMFKELLKTEFGVVDQQVLNQCFELVENKFVEEGRGEVDLRLPDVRRLVFHMVSSEFNLQRVTKPTPSSEETTETTPPNEEQDAPSQPVEESTDGGSSAPVVLDVNNKKTTNEHEYVKDKDGTTHTWTAKPGYKFKKVVKDNVDLWEFKNNKTANKVEVDNSTLGKVMLKVFYDSSSSFELVLLTDSDPSDSFSDPNEEQEAPSQPRKLDSSELVVEQLKLLTLDQQGQSVHDQNKFDVQNLTDLFNYTFKDGSKCTEVKYDDQLVWKYDKEVHGENYPTAVLFNTGKSFLFVESGTEYQYSFAYHNGEWRQVSGHRAKPLEPLEPDRVEIVTLESDETTKENDTTKYDKNTVGVVTNFRFKKDAKCTLVRYHGNTLWKYDKEVHGDDYPTIVTLNVNNNYLLVESGDKFRYVYSRYKRWKQELGFVSKYSEPIDFDKLDVFTLDTDGTTKENDTSHYELNKSINICIYKFKPNFKPVELKHDNQPVWKYDKDEHGDDYPTTFNLNKNKNVLLVESSTKYRYYYGYFDKTWKLLPLGFKSLTAKKKMKKQEDEIPTPSNFKFFTFEDDVTVKENDTTKYDVDDSTAVYTVTFKPATKCFEIKYKDDKVWKHSGDEHGSVYPKKISFNTKNNFLNVESDEYQYYFSFRDGEWTSVFGYNSKNKRKETEETDSGSSTEEGEDPSQHVEETDSGSSTEEGEEPSQPVEESEAPASTPNEGEDDNSFRGTPT